MKIFLLLALLISKTSVFSNEIYIGPDLSQSLGSLYDNNPKIKYEREILKSKDELLPRAFSNFRPEISGYYQKGKVDTVSKGFNITSDGIRTETNKGVVISQSIFDGGSSLSEIQISKNEILSQRSYLKNIEQNIEYNNTLTDLQLKNEYYSDRIKRLQPNSIDLDFLDEQVKKKLGLVDKNEIVIILDK